MPNSLDLADWTIATKAMVDGVNEVSATFNLRPEVCALCGVENGIDGGGVKAKYPMPLSQRDLVLDAKPMRMCMTCFRTHQSSWMSHRQFPTTKSE